MSLSVAIFFCFIISNYFYFIIFNWLQMKVMAPYVPLFSAVRDLSFPYSLLVERVSIKIFVIEGNDMHFTFGESLLCCVGPLTVLMF